MESHFTRVLTILQEFRTERERDPAFDPARPVTAHPDPHAIADRRTRRVSELFDEAYATLLLLLMRFFAHSDERTAELTGLQRAAFFPMMTTVIRPLGELLTLLPTGSDPPGSTAGPAFRFTRNITLLPHREAAWTVIQGELDALSRGRRGPLRGRRLSGGGARAAEPDAREPRPDRDRLRAGDGHRGRAVNLVLEFEGWCSLRLPTDPDPSDEPRGVSGYTFAFAGEPDFDRVLNLQAREGMTYRSHSPELGVTVRKAVRTDGYVVTALQGARVDLLGEPIIENRNWTLTLPGFEPIVPFHLRVAGDGVVARADGAAEPGRSEPAAVAGLADAARGPGRAGHGVRAGDGRRRRPASGTRSAR